MAHKETHEVATCLRNGCLWVGHFVVDVGKLDFGDDRFDAEHGLACYAGDARSSRADASLQGLKGLMARGVERKPAADSQLDALIERLKIAA